LDQRAADVKYAAAAVVVPVRPAAVVVAASFAVAAVPAEAEV
jgi:hypothetical protein